MLAHGYWNHPDPAETIRSMLRASPRLLASFDETYEEEDGEPGLLGSWAEAEGAPPEVRKLVKLSYDGSTLGIFDAVEVAQASGPDLGGHADSANTLYAYRRDGWIHYFVDEDGDPPGPTRMPLPLDEAYEIVAGAPYAIVDHAPEIVRGYLTSESPTRVELERLVRSISWRTVVHSRFYDFSDSEPELEASVLEAVLSHFRAD